jgi:hypothetical protein
VLAPALQSLRDHDDADDEPCADQYGHHARMIAPDRRSGQVPAADSLLRQLR